MTSSARAAWATATPETTGHSMVASTMLARAHEPVEPQAGHGDDAHQAAERQPAE